MNSNLKDGNGLFNNVLKKWQKRVFKILHSRKAFLE